MNSMQVTLTLCLTSTEASNVLHALMRRDSNLEAVVMTDPVDACIYAVRIIKERWFEAEDMIATDRCYAKLYNDTFGTSI